MDRPLTPRQRGLRIARKAVLPLLAAAGVVSLVLALPSWVRPTLDRGYLRTAVVDVGPVEAGVSGSGVVVPESELGVFCPLAASVTRVLLQPGNTVTAGDTIMEMDVSGARSGFSQLGEALALARNRRAQLDAELERQLATSHSNRRIKALEWENLATKTGQSRKLLELGAVSADRVREAELAEERAAIQLEQLDKGMASLRQQSANQAEALELEMSALRRQIQETRQLLSWAWVRAPVAGVLTRVPVEEGETVQMGQEVARVADLGAFRLDAVIAAVHARSVAPHMLVRVDVGQDEALSGWVEHVLPAAQGGSLRLDVRLDQPASPLLQLQLRVSLFVVTQRHPDALRVEKGPFVTGGGGVHDVFVIHGQVAHRTPAHIGLIGREHYQVTDGLSRGDEVIISSMQDYLHLADVDIRQGGRRDPAYRR
jgi:HlyD family secretion protein